MQLIQIEWICLFDNLFSEIQTYNICFSLHFQSKLNATKSMSICVRSFKSIIKQIRHSSFVSYFMNIFIALFNLSSILDSNDFPFHWHLILLNFLFVCLLIIQNFSDRCPVENLNICTKKFFVLKIGV